MIYFDNEIFSRSLKPYPESYGNWEKSFVLFGHINGKWTLCRYVYRRQILSGPNRFKYQYVLNDFELMQKVAK